jgi:hypothetical protein
MLQSRQLAGASVLPGLRPTCHPAFQFPGKWKVLFSMPLCGTAPRSLDPLAHRVFKMQSERPTRAYFFSQAFKNGSTQSAEQTQQPCGLANHFEHRSASEPNAERVRTAALAARHSARAWHGASASQSTGTEGRIPAPTGHRMRWPEGWPTDDHRDAFGRERNHRVLAPPSTCLRAGCATRETA